MTGKTKKQLLLVVKKQKREQGQSVKYNHLREALWTLLSLSAMLMEASLGLEERQRQRIVIAALK